MFNPTAMKIFQLNPNVTFEAILALLALEVNLSQNSVENENREEKKARLAFLKDFNKEFAQRYVIEKYCKFDNIIC